jgi:hypothetical protein
VGKQAGDLHGERSIGSGLTHIAGNLDAVGPPTWLLAEQSPSYMTNGFSSDAKGIWEGIPPLQKTRILNNVWCTHCAKGTTIIHYMGKVASGDLILEGECERCGGKVARLIENE